MGKTCVSREVSAQATRCYQDLQYRDIELDLQSLDRVAEPQERGEATEQRLL